MSEVNIENDLIRNITDLINTYFSEICKKDLTPIYMPGSFLINMFNSNGFKDFTKNLDNKCQYFLLKVFRETPYEQIKEVGDDALLWFYNLEKKIYEINKNRSKDSGIFWFSPEEITLEKITKQKLEELKSEVEKYKLL